MPDPRASAKPKSAAFYRRFGLSVIGAVFGGMILWSVLAPIDSAVVAAGQVVVESNRKAVQHLEGGVIGEILVREGQSVQAGEVLARLESTVQTADVGLIDGQLTELYARRARLLAERDSLDALASPSGLDVVMRQPAFQEKLAGQQQLFEARRQTRVTQISLLEERVVQQNERIAGLSAQIRSSGAQRKLIEDELVGVKELHSEGFAPLTRVRALERESERLSGERGALRASVAEAESIITEAHIEISRLKDTGREEAITELRDVEVQIAQLEERRVAAADALTRTEIKAPQAGRVLGLSVHTVGGVISPGQPLMEIVPGGDRLQIAARVSPRDIDKVAAGQQTNIRFSGFGSRTTPTAKGVVKTVSADSMADKTTGAPFYLVLIDLPADKELMRILRGQTLAPGMPAEAFIRTGAKPAILYFLKPLLDSMARSMREE